MSIIQFPPQIRAYRQQVYEWQTQSRLAARTFGSWLLGWPFPKWAEDAWAMWVGNLRSTSPRRATELDWAYEWQEFVNSHLAHHRQFQEAVNVACDELDQPK